MTFYGMEIGLVPTMSQIEMYISEKGMYITPQQVWDYWDAKKWLTLNGKPVKSLEAAVNVANGIVVAHDFYKGVKLKGKSKTQRKREKKAIKESIIGKARLEEIKLKREANKRKGFVRYEQQLKDSRWDAFRLFILKVRGRKCEICGDYKNLQVHHLHYTKDAKAWEYTCNEVMVVCKECHKKLHGIV